MNLGAGVEARGSELLSSAAAGEYFDDSILLSFSEDCELDEHEAAVVK